MVDPHDGACVCKAVHYRTHGEPSRVNVCHCTWCQRRTGSAFAVIAVFQESQIEWLGAEPALYRHHSDESGRWLDLRFCSTCGASVGFTLEWVPGVFAVNAGTFDHPSWLSPEKYRFRYIYMKSAQVWAQPPEGAECFPAHFRV